MPSKTLSPENETLLRAEIARLGLTAAEELIVGHATECIGLKIGSAAGDDLPLGASRYGGEPDLPPGVAWPRNEAGQYLDFLMQVHLAEATPPPVNNPLPATGHLYCFSGNDKYGSFDELLVLYHDVPPDALVRAPQPSDDERIPENGDPLFCHHLIVKTVIDLPEWSSDGEQAIVEALEEAAEDGADVYETYHTMQRGFQAEPGQERAGKIGGQPFWIGYVPDEPGLTASVPGDADDWVLLWWINSAYAVGANFGDAGYMLTYVKRAALARRDFSELTTEMESS